MAFYDRKQHGDRAEAEACDYLKRQGLALLEKNFTCRYGEIDLIMQDRHTIVFIEVRSRSNDRFGTALESVDVFKERKLIKTANYYLHSKGLTNKVNGRFDVVTFQKGELAWLKNAFEDDSHE